MPKQHKKANKSMLRSKIIALILGLFGISLIGVALAAGGGGSTAGIAFSAIATHVDTSVNELAVILTDVAIIAGIGFIMASFFKFHQHKLNPTQVPLSQGVTLLLIGAGLVLFPTMLPTATTALFGSQATIAKTGGTAISNIINGTGTKK